MRSSAPPQDLTIGICPGPYGGPKSVHICVRAKREQPKKITGFNLDDKAMSVLYVPCSLASGRGTGVPRP